MVTTFLRTFARGISAMAPKVVIVLGPPGSGKGTLCRGIVKNFGYVHLSAGDLLREERSRPGSQYGELIDSYIKDGKIVPVEITCSLLQNAMRQSGEDKFLIDGFPRNQDNLDGWNKTVAGSIDLQFVLFLECSLDICRDRCLGRGEAGSGRTDDNLDSLNKRFDTYQNQTKPIIEHYAKNDLVKIVDGTKRPDEVFDEVKQLFNQ